MTPEERLELLLDRIAEALIESQYVDSNDVADAQKFILNGQLQQGGGVGVLALFQKDIEANENDLQITTTDQNGEPIPTIQNIANNIDFDTLEIIIGNGPTINISDGGTYVGGLPITEYLFGENNPLNVSQFITLEKQQSIVDVERANEYLDTNIFELLPTGDTRQARIIRFFQELNALLPPTIETEQWDTDNDGNVDRLIDGTWSGAEQYSQDNSISYAQDNPDESNIGEEDAFIHRLKDTANDTNSSRTIEDIYNTVRPYLRDILEDTPGLEGLPEYENQSSGYLKFRNLNQGIIVRNTNQEFVQGLDPNNPTWLTSDYSGLLAQYDSEYDPNDNTVDVPNTHNFILNNAGTGFTITMWVRFLDKVSEGTLFNFGNPIRKDNPFGFRLETFVLNQDDTVEEYLSGSQGPIYTFRDYMNGNVDSFTAAENQLCQEYFDNTSLFKTTNTERFVRLQVREFGDFKTGTDRGIRDSHLANPCIHGQKLKNNPPDFNRNSAGHRFSADEIRILNYTNIPEDFNEWYFICATYNPSINEQETISSAGSNYGTDPNMWLNHINQDTGEFVNSSGFGNKCKVEIISRSDLLRARGFNT